MNTLIVITGPTASGKTALSIEVAAILGVDIISADSRQFYKGMQTGTAAPLPAEMKGVRHHFVGFLSPENYYSASMFERDVLNLLPQLFRKRNVVIMTGGSGLYIDAICQGIDYMPDIEPEIREKYIRKYREEGIEALRQELRLVDPEHYARADLRNPRRMMRALEVFASTGKPFSSYLNHDKHPRDFRIIKTGLFPPRDILYSRINKRVDTMIENGLVAEARSLCHLRHLNALQTVGYRELFSHFEGHTSLEEAVRLIKRNTRHYARRQITWWAGDKSMKRFIQPDTKEYCDYLMEEGISIRTAGS